MAIKGLFSGRYLAMNKKGRLYASVSPIVHEGRVGTDGAAVSLEHHIRGHKGTWAVECFVRGHAGLSWDRNPRSHGPSTNALMAASV